MPFYQKEHSYKVKQALFGLKYFEFQPSKPQSCRLRTLENIILLRYAQNLFGAG